MKIHPITVENLSESGFEEVNHYKNSLVFRLKRIYENELFPFFSPRILNYDEGRALAGVIGSMKNSKNNLHVKGGKINEAYAITCYSANFSKLRMPPIIGLDHKAGLEWCYKIADVMLEFPTTLAGLSDMIEHDCEICGLRVSTMNIF